MQHHTQGTLDPHTSQSQLATHAPPHHFRLKYAWANLLPSLIPLLLFTGDTSLDLSTLAAFGGAGVLAYLAALRESARHGAPSATLGAAADAADGARTLDEAPAGVGAEASAEGAAERRQGAVRKGGGKGGRESDRAPLVS